MAKSLSKKISEFAVILKTLAFAKLTFEVSLDF
jgi:hypothetical protein